MKKKDKDIEKLINNVCPPELLEDIEKDPNYLIIGIIAKLDMVIDYLETMNKKIDSIKYKKTNDLISDKVGLWRDTWKNK